MITNDIKAKYVSRLIFEKHFNFSTAETQVLSSIKFHTTDTKPKKFKVSFQKHFIFSIILQQWGPTKTNAKCAPRVFLPDITNHRKLLSYLKWLEAYLLDMYCTTYLSTSLVYMLHHLLRLQITM